MKKSIKLTIVIVLALLVIGVSVWTYTILKEPFLRKVLVEWLQSQFISATPDWKTYTPDNVIYFDSPFPIEWKTKKRIENDNGVRIIQGINKTNRLNLWVSVTSLRYINISPNPDYLNLLEKTEKEELQSETNFKWTDQEITCAGMPATLATYSFETNGNPYCHAQLFITGKNQNWTVQISSYQNDSNFQKWTKRIIDSVKIENKNQ